VPLVWEVDAATGRFVLVVTVRAPGGFGEYRLSIDDPHEDRAESPPRFSRIDRYFNAVSFSFKAGCDDRLDCAPAEPECCEPADDPPTIDPLARDFVSIRNALLDFAAQKYPSWTTPIEADIGVMMLELLAALGDEFSYIQDRIAREAYLETATQRRSVRQKARLVDYEIDDGAMAETWLEVTVDAEGTIPQGARVFALSESAPPLPFEIDQFGPHPSYFYVRPEWGRDALRPYAWDEGDDVLPAGATELYLEGEIPRADELWGVWDGRACLLETKPKDPRAPRQRHLVMVREADYVVDPLLGTTTTRIRWRKEHALPCAMRLADMRVSLNLVPALAGESRHRFFRVGKPPPGAPLDPPWLEPTIEREGPENEETCERPTVHRYGLPGTEDAGLAFVDIDDGGGWTPTVFVYRIGASAPSGDAPPPEDERGEAWRWVRTLMTAGASEQAFTLEDGMWRRIVGYRRDGEEHVHRDYAGAAGYTLRFGDGTFGALPPAGVYLVVYRLGTGRRANVAADAIQGLARPDDPMSRTVPHWVTAVRNPFAVTSGRDPERLESVKQSAPEAFKVDRHFAVRPEDYAHQAEKVDDVQRAHAAFRWTGSWHVAFVGVDAEGDVALGERVKEDVERALACARQAGREVIVADAKYVDVDLVITICLEPSAYEGEVRAALREVLFGRGRGQSRKGFFHPDHFTFGTPLRRAALEAAIHEVGGVRSVLGMRIHPRGHEPERPFRELAYEVARDAVIRVANDPDRPERGTVRFRFEGGA
jgi:hypothetical protein